MTARHRPRALAFASILAASSLAAAPALAQDAHYWTYGYGPIGQLTEGTIVGGVNDLSAVFYNPGATALIEKPRFTFTLTSVELASLTAPSAAGPQLDFDSTIFDVVPAVIAGRLASREGKADQFTFAFLSRHDTDWDLGYSEANVSGSSPDAAAGFGRVRERVLDYWVGPSWSHRLSDTVSVGVSPFFDVPRPAQPPLAHPRAARVRRRGGGVRRQGVRVQPRRRTRKARPRLASRPPRARRHRHHAAGADLERRQDGVQRHRGRRRRCAAPVAPARRPVSTPRTTRRGRSPAARRGAASAPPSTRPSSGSPRSTRTTSSSRRRPRSPALPRRSR